MILSGENANLLDELYENYLNDPGSIPADWKLYFDKIEMTGNVPEEDLSSRQISVKLNLNGGGVDHKQIGVQYLVESYRRFGHLAANLDPIGLQKPDRSLLELEQYGLNDQDLNQIFESGIETIGSASLADIINWLEGAYCKSIGVEYASLRIREEREWFQYQLESEKYQEELPVATLLRLYEKLNQAETFEKFLAQKYVGKKRFSSEGGESMIPLLDAAVEICGEQNVYGMLVGMAHRGRLNVLVNILEKPAGMIFAEFDENYNPDTDDYADVKYHLGYSSDRTTMSTNEVHLSLAFNPSHLEAVDPVVMGSVRARQNMIQDELRKRYLTVQIHGDAAFMGQGIVAETLNLGKLEGYQVGGSLHLVVNNQIGFTTLPHESRSTLYATDLAKGFQIPVIHVNADDLPAVYRAIRLALDYRHKFSKDIIIDLVCYRRLGHNETDEPAFTQPQMYSVIKKHPTTVKIYRQQLLEHPEITTEDIDFIEQGIRNGLEASFNKAKADNVQMKVDMLQGRWSQFSDKPLDSEPQTKLLRDQMNRINKALYLVPEGFTPNPKLKRFIDNRKKMFEGELPIDWGFAEALAFGSILENGFDIRLSGQDSQRGTFSHRHAVFHDIKRDAVWTPLNGISKDQGTFEVINAPLSEFSVLGFEFGYSLANPNSLVIWEAQFGDFVNSAQIMIDQFISCCEIKWRRLSGLVMLLPHGYEGQGPEHSSARLERFLQLCSRNNMQICNCTTPAQYFHLIRRQILRKTRKPLVIMSPKSLLRLADAGSQLDDLGLGVFREVLYDKLHETKQDDRDIKKMLICSGKVYYDLVRRRKELKRQEILIVRIEQLYPFPEEQIRKILEQYPDTKEYLWVQEEPKDQGPWYFMKDRIRKLLPQKMELKCVARPKSPSPAAGLFKVHAQELEYILEASVGKK